MRKLMSLFFVAFIVAPMFGCNTSEGVGKDLEKAGQEIQDAAQDVKDDL